MNNEGRSPGVVNYQGSGAAMLRRDLAYEKSRKRCTATEQSFGGFMENLNINFDQTISASTINMITAGAILVLSVLIVLIIVVIKRWHGRFIPMALGLLAYIVFGFMFSQLIMSILALVPNIDQTFQYNMNAYIVIYNILLAVGFGIARWFATRIMVGRYDREGDVILAGTGLAVGDAVMTYGLSILSFYVYAQAISSNGLQKVIEDMLASGISEENVLTEYTANISQLFNSPEAMWLLMGVSAVLDIALNIMLFMVVYGIARQQVNYMYAYYAVILQFVTNIMFQLYDAFSLTSIIVLFSIKLVIVAAAAFFIKQFVMKGITYSND